MSNFINVGATVNGRRPKTKKALKEALRDDPQSVYFDGTSMMGNTYDGGVDGIPAGTVLQVVGPDPYNTRNWYASVSSDGKCK